MNYTHLIFSLNLYSFYFNRHFKKFKQFTISVFAVIYSFQFFNNVFKFTGMFQRLDKMRKQAFASVCLFGTEGDSTISGVWIWRGQDLAFEVNSNIVFAFINNNVCGILDE